jgi:hypothetical protein
MARPPGPREARPKDRLKIQGIFVDIGVQNVNTPPARGMTREKDR